MAHGLAFDVTGYVYTAGFTYNDPETRGDDITWTKYVLSADTLAAQWVRKTNWCGSDASFDIATGRSGDVYICGADRQDTTRPNLSGFNIMRVNPADGSILWSRSLILDSTAVPQAHQDLFPSFYDNWYEWENCATSIAVAPDGCVVAGGFGLSGQTGYDAWVVKADPAGNLLWQTSHSLISMPSDDAVFNLVVANDGTIYAAGLGESEDGLVQLTVLHLADTGGTLGCYALPTVGDGNSFATQLALDDAEPQSIYVTGLCEYQARNGQIVTQKLSHDLQPLWGVRGATYGGIQDDVGFDVCWNEGHVYVTGMVLDDVAVLCYSDSSVDGGLGLWQYLYGSPDGLKDFGSCLCVTDSEHIYLGGQCDRIDSVYDWSSMLTARLSCPAGISEVEASRCTPQLRLLPNPTTKGSAVRFGTMPDGLLTVQVFDVTGRCVATPFDRHAILRPGAAELDSGGLPAGMYLVRVDSDETGTATIPLLIVPSGVPCASQ